jgi:phage baseplate assembly protein W
MALQRIVPGLSKNTKITTKIKLFSDVDLSFTAKQGSEDNGNGVFRGDLYKKVDAAAVKQSVQNIILTNQLEKPFEPKFGANLRSFLFGLSSSFSDDTIKDQIKTQVERWEPRAKITDVIFFNGQTLIPLGTGDISNHFDNTIRIVIEFDINNKGFSTSVQLNRFR